MTEYRLKHEIGHYAYPPAYPAGTVVEGKPYPADPRYVEITLPNGVRLTVDPDHDIEEQR